MIEIEDSRYAHIVGQSRRVPVAQMGFAERGLAMRTSVTLRRRSSPDVNWDYAEYLSLVLWSWSRWK